MRRDRAFAAAILATAGVASFGYAAFGQIKPGFTLLAMTTGALVYLITTRGRP